MNWTCPYCGGQNSDNQKKCVTCNCRPGDWDLARAKRRIGSAVSAGVLVVLSNFVMLFVGDRFVDSSQKDLCLGTIVLTVVLEMGVLRKSRTCVVLLVVARVLGVVLQWHETGKVFAALCFFAMDSYFLFQAFRGTFAYHRIMERNRSTYVPQTPSCPSPALQYFCDTECTRREEVSDQIDEPQAGQARPESELEPVPLCAPGDELSRCAQWQPAVSRLRIPTMCERPLLKILDFMEEL
jgi:hypothetical protein